MSGHRTVSGPAGALLALLLPVWTLLGQGSAQADDSYRYWSFWQQQDRQSGQSPQWKYATQGPSVLKPADGDVLGFRFAVSKGSKEAGTPRGGADFARTCGGTKAAADSKRVAVTVDFGTAQDAAEGEHPPKPRSGCARVDRDATAADALAKVAKPLRYNSDSLLCAVGGYPKSGCGDRTSGSATPGNDSAGSGGSGNGGQDSGSGNGDDGGSGLPTGLGIGGGVLVVAALAGGAVWQSRRRRE